MRLKLDAVNKKTVVKIVVHLAIMIGFFLCFDMALAGKPTGISGVIANIKGTFATFARFITAASYLVGLGFALGSILKFKAHRDNPTQIPIGTPIALLFIAVALLFLPYLFGQMGVTVFGSGHGTGVYGLSGITAGA